MIDPNFRYAIGLFQTFFPFGFRVDYAGRTLGCVVVCMHVGGILLLGTFDFFLPLPW